MISSIIQALFHENPSQYKWARKKKTRNLWFAKLQKQVKGYLSTIYKANNYIFNRKIGFKEKVEWRI